MIILKTKQWRKRKTHAATSYPCNIIQGKAKQFKTAYNTQMLLIAEGRNFKI
jgi:hypothetical protein